ncbi:orotate phosphoribosyltransferase [Aneurinibacillus migulanus]|uniref:Orotate phosphoribosyltransferase n=1 Tax=Aneurinibacillus migulanus TaxID=47500 RepID=A0A0D1XMX8_ANEMI|nr:orotate phosphoribosyltransferase [Aneurinibacillus migulanus]KIV50416.1 orotate phosphoribosyltransferase [Aneurinibacillus migulanus]KIV55681.1 orotate phosphoribosyltransferase [Aneurinibacillus migulanus]KON95696.1 orotate phosphoribosyltransferase [Aneurinibacillus migulanus]KPD05046.1 orotate phosphoribosyltransferase [Aneurinibacillus migulanus]MCP1355671.1 orotate phosphoribosyltransferase [Aneurinibacillus migulanus]
MPTNTDTARQIAENLLDIDAVALRPDEPFTWTSGIKSPIYCDNRMTMSYPEVRQLIYRSFAAQIREKYGEAQVIAGTATAGIPHAAWVAEEMGLPMAYVRSKPKGHGKGNQIEGRLAAGAKVIVIEDLISTGGSSIEAARAVQEAGGEVLAVLAIFSYQFPTAEQAFAEAGFTFETLSNYTTLLDVAKEKGTIRPEQIETLKAWRENPQAYKG